MSRWTIENPALQKNHKYSIIFTHFWIYNCYIGILLEFQANIYMNAFIPSLHIFLQMYIYFYTLILCYKNIQKSIETEIWTVSMINNNCWLISMAQKHINNMLITLSKAKTKDRKQKAWGKHRFQYWETWEGKKRKQPADQRRLERQRLSLPHCHFQGVAGPQPR